MAVVSQELNGAAKCEGVVEVALSLSLGLRVHLVGRAGDYINDMALTETGSDSVRADLHDFRFDINEDNMTIMIKRYVFI